MHGVVIEWCRGKELVASARTAIIADLTAPSVSCTAPTSLRVGTAVTITPSATDTEIASYACKTDPSLPASLTLNGTSGMIGQHAERGGCGGGRDHRYHGRCRQHSRCHALAARGDRSDTRPAA